MSQDTRQVQITVTWPEGEAHTTRYSKTADELPALVRELLDTYAGEWTSLTVRPA
jgi:hypothetical protein